MQPQQVVNVKEVNPLKQGLKPSSKDNPLTLLNAKLKKWIH